jgi:hypothetical protein
MSRITVPVDPNYVILEVPEYRVEERQVRVGRVTQTRRERVEVMQETPSGWTTEALGHAIAGANGIWAPAEIQFNLGPPTTRRFRPPGDGTRVDENAYQYLINQMPGRLGRITLLLVQRFARWDLGGQASRGTCILPSNLSVQNRGRVFAHEFGHLLGLNHIDTPDTNLQNVMRPGLVAGNQLTPDQIRDARQSPLATRAAAASPRSSP